MSLYTCTASEYCTKKTRIVCCFCKTPCCTNHRTGGEVRHPFTGQLWQGNKRSYICTNCKPKE